jgi:hypothetical protein
MPDIGGAGGSANAPGPDIHIGQTWFVLGALGAAANFVGGWLWLGLGPALFITGTTVLAVAWGTVAFFLRLAFRLFAVQLERGRA